MFAYNPTVNNRAGEIYGTNLKEAATYDADAIRTRAEADLAKALRQHQGIIDGVGLVGDAAKKVVGFMVGGPAGAMAASSMGGGGGGGSAGGGDGLLGSIISSFANKKAMDAKDRAYTSFFDKHGKDLGFDPNYLDELKAMSRDDRLMAFDLMTSQPGQRLGSMAYMNQQANLYGGGRGTGGGGGGGGGSEPFYTVQ